MLVLVTGGTGFVGSHSAAEIIRAGHRVRLLVRNRTRVAAALYPLGIDPTSVEVVVGDATDETAVARATRGCDAVLHAASVYSFDSREHEHMRTVNARSTDVVLTAARAAGADPIVYVSSIAALLPSEDSPVTTQSPVGTPRETYMATKAAAEVIARRHQAEGAPVVITYPLACLGPHDPKLGDQIARLRNALLGLMPIWPIGSIPIGDVRDVARLHAAVLRPGLGPRRFIAPGHHVRTQDYVQTLRQVTGRLLPTIYLPATTMFPIGALTGLVQRFLPVHIPAEYGAIYLCAVSQAFDAAAATKLLGTPTRSLAQTMADTVGWLHSSGQLHHRLAGRAAAGYTSTADAIAHRY